jgi:transposase
MKLTQPQWELVEPFVKKALPSKEISGRPRQDDQQILNGIY